MTFLLYLGFAASLVTIFACSCDNDKMARNWNAVQIVFLWIYFLTKG